MPARTTSVVTLVIVALVTVTTMVLGIFGAVNYFNTRDQQIQELKDALVLDADQVSPSLALPVWNFDRQQIEKVVESMMQDRILYGIVVRSEKKAIICARQRDSQWHIQPTEKEILPAGFLVGHREFSFSDRPIGSVTLYGTTKFVEAGLKKKLAWLVLNILTLDAALTLSLYLLFWRLVLKPLKEVEAYAGAVSSSTAGAANLHSRRFYGELENLRASMERMVEQLEARYAELREESRKHRESESRFHTLIESAPVAIVVVRYGKHLYNNKMYRDMFRFEDSDILPGRSILEQIAPEFRNEIEERSHQRELGLPVPDEYETIGRRKDDSRFNLHVGITRVQLADGPASIAFLADITERKQAEERIQRSREQLRALSSRLETLREQERTHIAREIHDHLGQLLTALKMDIHLVQRKIVAVNDAELREALAAKISSAQQLTDETIIAVQKIASELRPGVLDRLGLSAAIEIEAQTFQNRSGLPCTVSIPKSPVNLSQKHATAMFRIFQELLTNIARHAKATRVSVLFAVDGNNLLLEVRDDGVGIRQTDLEKSTSLGILGMQERVAILGGSIALGGPAGHGTTVTVKLPLG